MKILGVISHYHYSSCALVIDDSTAFAVQEEQLSSKLFDARLPCAARKEAKRPRGIGIWLVELLFDGALSQAHCSDELVELTSFSSRPVHRS